MSEPSNILGETQRVWVCVLKMSDLTGPRRRADRPRVMVKALPKRPGLELDRWVKTSRRAKRMRVVNVVYEAMPQPAQPGGRDNPFIKPTQKPDVDAAMKLLRQQLRCDGYTVNGDMTVWHLYIIELMPLSGDSGGSAGYLYVGQTSQPLEDRIRQHREGHHNPKGQRLHSLACHKRFLRPRLDLLPSQFSQTLYCQEDALTAEADLRLAMEADGFVVEGGTEKLGSRRRELGIDSDKGATQ